MSNSFTNQVLAQMELHNNHGEYENKVYTLPKKLDEEVARLHLDKLGAKLTTLSAEQAEYLGLPIEGRNGRGEIRKGRNTDGLTVTVIDQVPVIDASN